MHIYIACLKHFSALYTDGRASENQNSTKLYINNKKDYRMQFQSK